MNWQAAMQEHGPKVWAIAWKILGNEADASDCFQEVFLKAVQVNGREKIRNLPALLGCITTQRAIDILRRKRSGPDVSGSAEQMQLEDNRSLKPDDRLRRVELADRLRCALGKIPAREAEVFCLKVLDEFSYRQIADYLQIQENHVGVLVHRARTKLQELLRSAAVEDLREVP